MLVVEMVMKMMTWYREGEVPPQIRCRRQSEPGSCPPSQPEVMMVMMMVVMMVMMMVMGTEFSRGSMFEEDDHITR